MRWHQIVRLFLAIYQEHVHSESEAMSKCLLARSTWFHKVPENNSFSGRKYTPPRYATYHIIIDFQLAGSTLSS